MEWCDNNILLMHLLFASASLSSSSPFHNHQPYRFFVCFKNALPEKCRECIRFFKSFSLVQDKLFVLHFLLHPTKYFISVMNTIYIRTIYKHNIAKICCVWMLHALLPFYPYFIHPKEFGVRIRSSSSSKYFTFQCR